MLNLWRSMRASADLSAVGRQGWPLLITHPVTSVKAMPAMLRAFASKRAAFASERAIKADPNYARAMRAKLDLASSTWTRPSHMEEAYMSRYANRVPVVAGSARAYTTYLNEVRFATFKVLTRTLERKGVSTLENDMVIANFINIMSGRGNAGPKLMGAMQAANTVYFAPRFVLSRFQAAVGQPLWYGAMSGKLPVKATMAARKLVLKEYSKILMGIGAMAALGMATGAYKLDLDPASRSYGFMVVGDRLIDVFAGVGQATRYMFGTVTKKRRNKWEELETISGEDWLRMQMRFHRTKLSPALGTVGDYMVGKDVRGQEVPELGSVDFWARYVAPITFAELKETLEADGVPAAVADTLVEAMGFGVIRSGDTVTKR
jgi:hypothetical protein